MQNRGVPTMSEKGLEPRRQVISEVWEYRSFLVKSLASLSM